MKNINKTITIEFGNYIKCSVFFAKESVKLNTSIILYALKASNSIDGDSKYDF